MNHAVVTEYLADYLEGDLALDKRALVDAHLDTCATCAQEVREMQQTIRLLRALPEPEVPPMIAANVMRRIRAGETEPSFFERLQRTFGAVLEPSFVLPASAVAVAALVIFAIQGGGPLSRALTTVVEVEPAAAPRSSGSGQDAELAVEPEEIARLEAGEGDRAFGASAADASSSMAMARPRVPEERVATSEPIGADEPVEAVEPADAAGAAETAEYAAREAMGERVESAPAWAASPMPAAAARPRGGAGGFFGDGGLAQGFAGEVGGAATRFSNPIPGERAAAVPVTLSRRVGGEALAAPDAGGEDPRDVWLARALEHPAEFAGYIARRNLAEQELWVERLSERAQSRGLLGELIAALRSTGDEKAAWLADDFAAAAEADSAGAPGDEPTAGPADSPTR